VRVVTRARDAGATGCSVGCGRRSISGCGCRRPCLGGGLCRQPGGSLRLGRVRGPRGWLRGRLGGRLSRGSLLLGRGRGDALGCECFLEPARYRRLDAGGRSLDELAHLLEFLKGLLRFNAEFCCDLVHAWFCHSSPVSGLPRDGADLVVDGSHFEPLISCPLVNLPVLLKSPRLGLRTVSRAHPCPVETPPSEPGRRPCG